MYKCGDARQRSRRRRRRRRGGGRVNAVEPTPPQEEAFTYLTSPQQDLQRKAKKNGSGGSSV